MIVIDMDIPKSCSECPLINICPRNTNIHSADCLIRCDIEDIKSEILEHMPLIEHFKEMDDRDKIARLLAIALEQQPQKAVGNTDKYCDDKLLQQLTESDLIELRERFGDGVEYVVRDMLSGKGERWKMYEIQDVIESQPSVNPQYTDDEIQTMQDLAQAEIQKAYELGKAEAEQFAKWVAREIFDEMWEYNKDAFAEIACRKLKKLGIVRAKGDK